MVGGVSGAGPQQIQIGAVGKGAQPDLSGLDDEQALVLLLMQRGYLVQRFISGSEKERAQLNDNINKVQKALDNLNAVGNGPETALKNTLQKPIELNVDDFPLPLLDPDNLVGLSMPNYQATVDTGSYPGLKLDDAPAVGLRAKNGKMYMVRAAAWKRMISQIKSDPAKYADSSDFITSIDFADYSDSGDGRNIAFTVDAIKNKAQVFYYKSDYESVINDPKQQKMSTIDYYSPNLMTEDSINTVKSLGLTFPGDTSSREDWHKLISSAQSKMSQFNQDIQDLSRKVTQNTHYMYQYQEMGSTINANQAHLITDMIKNFILS